MESSNSAVKSVAKSFHVLNVLERAGQALSLGEIAQLCGYPKSTVHALLQTLVQERAVAQDALSGKYRLGMRLFELGSAVSASWDILDAARPHMRSLMLKTGESVHLGMLDQREVVLIEHISSGSTLRIVAERGTRFPLHCSALGKAVLSCLPDIKANALIRTLPLQAFTPHTIASEQALATELAAVRKNGVAVEDGEMRIGMRAVAAPITCGTECYALGITGMFRRTSGDEFLSAEQLVKSAADAVASELLGRIT